MTTVAALGLVALVALAACGSGGGSAGGGSAKQKTACVMLPDADSSSRWDISDRPALDTAFKQAGFKVNIQNALNDTGKYVTLAQQELTQGCSIMLLVDLNGTGIQVAQKATSQGIPVIAYDRPIKGANYYISFDNFRVGELEGQMIVDGLKANGVDPSAAKVVYVGGDPTDGNAKQFRDGADSTMKAVGIKPAFEVPGTWDTTKAATGFEQAYTALSGKVDAVWAANDTHAAAVIQVLDKYNLRVPVSGQDGASVGLRNILLGKQVATVYKPYQLESQAAVDLAKELLAGQQPTIDRKAPDGTPFIVQNPVVVNADNMQIVFKDGNAKISDVCTGPVAAECKKHGLD